MQDDDKMTEDEDINSLIQSLHNARDGCLLWWLMPRSLSSDILQVSLKSLRKSSTKIFLSDSFSADRPRLQDLESILAAVETLLDNSPKQSIREGEEVNVINALHQLVFLLHNKCLDPMLSTGEPVRNVGQPKAVYIPPALRQNKKAANGEKQFIISILRFFEKWATIYGGVAMSSWPLFFTDSFRLEKNLSAVFSSLSRSMPSHLDAELKFSSVLLSLCVHGFMGDTEVKCQGIRTVSALIISKSAEKHLSKIFLQWKSSPSKQCEVDKPLKTILKIVKVLLLSLSSSSEETIAMEVLSTLYKLAVLSPLITVEASSVDSGIQPLEEWFTKLLKGHTSWRSLEISLTQFQVRLPSSPSSCINLALRYFIQANAKEGRSQSTLDLFGSFLHGVVQRESSTHCLELLAHLLSSYFSHRRIHNLKSSPSSTVYCCDRGSPPNLPGEVDDNLWRILNDLINHENHKVKQLALEAVGNLEPGLVPRPSDRSLEETVASILIDSASHSISGVRATAYRSLGEWLQDQRMDLRCGILASQGLDMMVKGCKDSNLAVRIQATWALTKLLLAVKSDVDLKLLWRSSEQWREMSDLMLQLCKDSEKIQATAILGVTCLVNVFRLHALARNYGIGDDLHLNSSTDYLIRIFDCIHQTFVNVESCEEAIERKFSQKIVTAAVNCLGVVCWTLISFTRVLGLTNCLDEYLRSQHGQLVQSVVLRCYGILLPMFQNGFLSLQIVAGRILGKLLGLIWPSGNEDDKNVMMTSDHILSLIEVLTMVVEKICEARCGHHPVIASTKFLIRKSRESSLHMVALSLLSRCLSIICEQNVFDLNHRMMEMLNYRAEACTAFLEQCTDLFSSRMLEASPLREKDFLDHYLIEDEIVAASTLKACILNCSSTILKLSGTDDAGPLNSMDCSFFSSSILSFRLSALSQRFLEDVTCLDSRSAHYNAFDSSYPAQEYLFILPSTNDSTQKPEGPLPQADEF
eukprot:scaffold1931_cov215-Ochromonas_danica.AAC.8